MSFRRVSTWAIKNPVPPLVLFAALMLAGLMSFFQMDVTDAPEVEFPAVVVRVSQPGAAPTEIESQITQRIESAARGVSGVDEISSYVGEGYSRTEVQFAIGTPVDRALNDTRNAISQVRGDLPEGILEPQVTRVDIAGGPIGIFAVEADDMTLEELSWFVDNTVARRFLTIEGMAGASRSGGVNREIRVILDPARLQAFGLTAGQVNSQLRQINLNAAGGRAEIGGAEQAVRVLGNAADAFALGQTEIAIGNGRRVKLSDIAEVRDASGEQRSIAKMGGREVVSIRLERAKGASDVTVYQEALKVIDELEAQNPGLRFTQLYTEVPNVIENYNAALHALIEGAILAVIVVFLFLRDWRATIISAVAIPLSAIPTFWFMDMLGFTLNFISLLALSLVAGVLVDDAIVEIENIVRHMRMGKNNYQASVEAAEEISLPVLATTMAIVAVFLPVGLMPGISGQFFIQFGLTVVFAVLMSLAVARLLTPMLAAYFLKSEGEREHGQGRVLNGYMRVLAWSLRHRWKTALIGGGGAMALTVLTYATLPMTFQPPRDNDFSQVIVEMVPGTTLEQSEAVFQQVTAVLEEQPEVEDAFQRIEPTGGRVFVKLSEDRERTSVEFERATAPLLRGIADARISFQSQSGGWSGRDISMTLGGEDPVVLEAAARELLAQMAELPGIRAPRIEGDVQRPEIVITPRLDLAADLGVTTAALSQAIRVATLGEIDQNTAKFSLADRQVPIRVMLDESAREDLSAIRNLPVPTSGGGSVPLHLVADIGFGAGPTEIRRFNQVRRIVVGADLAPGLVTGDGMAQINALPFWENMPQGVERIVAGDQKWQAELLFNFIVAVISGVLLVFAVLVLLYKRIMAPLVNMGSLLLAPLGGGIALHLTGSAISMPVFIGILMLLGIVAKNSILLIDFALEEMQNGVPKNEAILDAGHKRAQPIVMTTIAMVAGMVPTALALTGDASFRSPMGWVVIGGLLLSTLLTLLIVPASFSIADSLEKWIGKRAGRLLTHKPGLQPGAGAVPQAAE